MMDLQLNISRWFNTCANFGEQENVIKAYKTKIVHYKRQLHYCNIVLNAGKAESQSPDKKLPAQVRALQEKDRGHCHLIYYLKKIFLNHLWQLPLE